MPNSHLWTQENAHDRAAKVFARVDADETDTQHIFTQTFAEECLKSRATPRTGPLAGALVSVKDLFDVKSFVTRAGTTFLEDTSPADKDAAAIGLLRDAGALLIGHTNMTELAYSGLGLNPHYNTPRNALDPKRIPGGSTSGGAVSVALGLADIAVGTDTGGSCRIPAAFNGIVGFKPSQSAISRNGCKPLSQTLDSVGVMGKSVAMCRAAFEVMATGKDAFKEPVSKGFVIPTNFGMDDLEPLVAKAFKSAVGRLEAAGHAITYKNVSLFDKLAQFPAWHVTSVECRANYQAAFSQTPKAFDPRVLSRMKRAEERSAVAYRECLNLRDELISEFEIQFTDETLLMPTVPIEAPQFSDLRDDASFNSKNLQVLRNPSVANVMDACSISIPFQFDRGVIGVMLTAPSKRDDAILNLADSIERIFE
ncbi:amidase family protein [Thalassobius sp. I31.1]|uniref:amidase family protein n=1 Tax=Thalassobius sp. I31.1 TaxID=2109912 RepID=UPI000D1A6A82|nr:amidase family protein [Thalassobius sp. I31.1]